MATNFTGTIRMADHPPLFFERVAYLQRHLRYEPETGKLFWREKSPDDFAEKGNGGAAGACARWNGKHAGKEAFTTINPGGYHCSAMPWGPTLAHRAIWAIVTGEWPQQQLDHIDGDRANNRWANLRLATASENSRNKALRSDNSSGACGVYLVRGKWQASVRVSGRNKSLGYFHDKDDAIAARRKADAELGFSSRHGGEK